MSSAFASQVHAARGLMKWSQDDLAYKADVGRKTITNIENESRATYVSTTNKIVRVLHRAGIELIPENGGGIGVRFRKPAQRL